MDQKLAFSPGASPSRGIDHDLRQVGEPLLRLYQAAWEYPVPMFQDHALELLRPLIAFEGAWWGRAGTGWTAQVHSSHRVRLPEDVAERLNRTDPTNLVAMRTRSEPGRVLAFGPAEWAKHPDTAALAGHMGIQHALCVSQTDEATGQASFISLARNQPKRRFSEREQGLFEIMVPHLLSALSLCCMTQMSRRRSKGNAALVTDVSGHLYLVDGDVAGLLEREWPTWAGMRLPAPLLSAIGARVPTFLGRRLRADLEWAGETVLMSLRLRTPVDVLTSREREVAQAYAAGLSHKQVAHYLALAPTTVRHHLRNVYDKLDVHDKAALARRLGVGDGFA